MQHHRPRETAWGGLRQDPARMSDARLYKLREIRTRHVGEWVKRLHYLTDRERIWAGLPVQNAYGMWLNREEPTIRAMVRQLLHIVCEQARRLHAPELAQLDEKRAALLRVLNRGHTEAILERANHIGCPLDMPAVRLSWYRTQRWALEGRR